MSIIMVSEYNKYIQCANLKVNKHTLRGSNFVIWFLRPCLTLMKSWKKSLIWQKILPVSGRVLSFRAEYWKSQNSFLFAKMVENMEMYSYTLKSRENIGMPRPDCDHIQYWQSRACNSVSKINMDLLFCGQTVQALTSLHFCAGLLELVQFV